MGVGGRSEGRGRSVSLGRGSDGRGRTGLTILGHRVEAERGLAPIPGPADHLDRSGRETVEAAATGATPRADGTGDRLDRDLRMDLEGIVAVETIALAAVIRQEHDSHVALPTPRLAVPAVGKSAHIRMIFS